MEAWLQGIFADTPVLTVPWSIDYFSVIAGVLTGALFACDRKLDIIGTVVRPDHGLRRRCCATRSCRGTGVYFTHPDLIVTCILICAFVFYFRGVFKHLEATVFLADALSVGLFALAGASKAVAFERGHGVVGHHGRASLRSAAALSATSASAKCPACSSAANYAVAWAWRRGGVRGAGAIRVPLALAGIACVFAVVALRYWSVYFDWRTTSEADLTPRIARVGCIVRAMCCRGFSCTAATPSGISATPARASHAV